jgi:hypothetical protein
MGEVSSVEEADDVDAFAWIVDVADPFVALVFIVRVDVVVDSFCEVCKFCGTARNALLGLRLAAFPGIAEVDWVMRTGREISVKGAVLGVAG